ncbi:MAG: DUF998 domain-containing protein [Chloroflexi bacterium]|nr:DUF998 domain-containing protein [Chloroflexota bacterium]
MRTQTGWINRNAAYLAMCGVAVPLVFSAMVIVGGVAQEGYSHASQAISELGRVEAGRPFVQNLNFIVTGILVIVFAIGLHHAPGLQGGAMKGPVLIGVFGLVTAVAQPAFSCDPGCGGATGMGLAHNVTGVASFLAVVAGIGFIGKRFRTADGWERYAKPSLATAVAALVALLTWIIVSKIVGVDSVNGVLQRVFVGIVLLWIGFIGARVWAHSIIGSGRERQRVLEWSLYGSAAASVIGIVYLVGFFASGVGELGTANDVAVIAQYLLMIPMALALHRAISQNGAVVMPVTLAVGVGGMIGVVVLQGLLVANAIAFEIYIVMVNIGFIVVLGWLLALKRGSGGSAMPGSTALTALAGLYVGYPLWALVAVRRLREGP